MRVSVGPMPGVIKAPADSAQGIKGSAPGPESHLRLSCLFPSTDAACSSQPLSPFRRPMFPLARLRRPRFSEITNTKVSVHARDRRGTGRKWLPAARDQGLKATFLTSLASKALYASGASSKLIQWLTNDAPFFSPSPSAPPLSSGTKSALFLRRTASASGKVDRTGQRPHEPRRFLS